MIPKTICFYFELHQPFRVNLTETTNPDDYYEGPKGDNEEFIYGNKNIFEKVAKNSYLPATEAWFKLLNKHSELKFSLALSGTLLDQCVLWPEFGLQIITNIRKLVATGRVELLAETYYHSLACLFSTAEFVEQVDLHMQRLKILFDYSATSFRNTELIYNDHVGAIIRELGFRASVIEDVAADFDQESSVKLAKSKGFKLNIQEQQLVKGYRFAEPLANLSLVVKSYRLVSSLFALRHFSVKELVDLTINQEHDPIGIFTDFEIFGEHNSAESKTFDKLEAYINQLKESNYLFATVSELGEKASANDWVNFPEISHQEHSSWTNSWHSLVSWRGNELQEDAFVRLVSSYKLAQKLKNLPDGMDRDSLLDYWRRLTTSDHFYYMSQLPGEDGIVHAMFNAYKDPEEAHATYVSVLDRMNKIIQSKLDNPKKKLVHIWDSIS